MSLIHADILCALLCLVTQSCPTLCNPMDCSPARLLCPWGFSRHEYWSRLPCPPPGDLPNPGMEPRSPALQVGSLPSEPPGKPWWNTLNTLFSCFFPCDSSSYSGHWNKTILFFLLHLSAFVHLYFSWNVYPHLCISETYFPKLPFPPWAQTHTSTWKQ